MRKMQQAGSKRRGATAAALAILVLVGVLTVAPSGAAPAPLYRPTLAPQCGGQTVVKQAAIRSWPRSTYWQCTFSEDFDGSTLNSRFWTVQTTAASGFGQGGECFMDTPNNVQVRNGALHLVARKEAAPFTCHKPDGTSFQSQWTAGSVMTYSKFTQTYGRFEIRAQLPATTAPGLQFAYWLWPQDVLKYGYQWPMSGEIDVMEWYSKYPNHGIPSLHYYHPTLFDPNITSYNCVVGDVSEWHTYTLEWSPQAIKILYDGQVCLVNTNWTPENGISKPGPFDHPFMVALTQALGVLGTENAVNAATPTRNVASIDYLYVWS